MHIHGLKFWVTWVAEETFSMTFVTKEMFNFCSDPDSMDNSGMQEREDKKTIQNSSYLSPLLNRTSFG